MVVGFVGGVVVLSLGLRVDYRGRRCGWCQCAANLYVKQNIYCMFLYLFSVSNVYEGVVSASTTVLTGALTTTGR